MGELYQPKVQTSFYTVDLSREYAAIVGSGSVRFDLKGVLVVSLVCPIA